MALREYFATVKTYEWLAVQWTRVVLTIATLLIMLIPIIIWIAEPSNATKSIKLSGIIGLIGHGSAYFFYRYRLLNMWSLATIVLSTCIIFEAAVFKILYEMLDEKSAIMFLLMSLTTLSVFTYAITYLRKIVKEMEIDHV